MVRHQDVHVLEHTLVLLLVVHEQLSAVPPVDAYPVGHLVGRLVAGALLDRHQPVLPNLAVHLSDELTERAVVVGGDSRHVLQPTRRHLPRHLLELLNGLLTQTVHVTQHLSGVVLVRDELHARTHQRVGQHHRRGRAVTSTRGRALRRLAHHAHR